VYSLKEYDKCENASEAVLPGHFCGEKVCIPLWAGKETMLFWWILWEEAYWNVQKPQQDIWG
jgi:hypothetical protein